MTVTTGGRGCRSSSPNSMSPAPAAPRSSSTGPMIWTILAYHLRDNAGRGPLRPVVADAKSSPESGAGRGTLGAPRPRATTRLPTPLHRSWNRTTSSATCAAAADTATRAAHPPDVSGREAHRAPPLAGGCPRRHLPCPRNKVATHCMSARSADGASSAGSGRIDRWVCCRGATATSQHTSTDCAEPLLEPQRSSAMCSAAADAATGWSAPSRRCRAQGGLIPEHPDGQADASRTSQTLPISEYAAAADSN